MLSPSAKVYSLDCDVLAMEDATTVVLDFSTERDNVFAGVYDGHGG
jgi:serine/threonine protein phosphatase PrpC